jgi:beta-galactosidase beta subunit
VDDAGSGEIGEKNSAEARKRYIDMQRECAAEGLGYNEEKNVEFFPGKPGVCVFVPAGTFGIFFPEDVYATIGAEEELVFKVRVEWE